MASEQVSIAVRRLLTMLLLLLLLGIFFTLYFWVYVPRQHADYNKRTFSALHKVSDNFLSRIQNEIKSSSDSLRDDKNKSLELKVGDVTQKDLYNSFPDSVLKTSHNIDAAEIKKMFRETDKVATILTPIVNTYATSLESVLLVERDNGNVLYQNQNLNIALLKKDTALKKSLVDGPAVSDVAIGGRDYKLFVLPFKVGEDSSVSYVFAGLVSAHDYRANAQSFPFFLVLVIGIGVIFVLLSIPFLKIFMLSRKENITVTDVRALIAVTYIFPFFLVILCLLAWLNHYKDNENSSLLRHVQHEIDSSFHAEINRMLLQAETYDSILRNPNPSIENAKKDSQQIYGDKVLTNLFYPHVYQNIDGIHWMGTDGRDKASWGVFNRTQYFNLPERAYYKDLLKRKTNAQGQVNAVATPFVIEPVLSRLSLEYTINVAIPSHDIVVRDKDSIILLDVSAKMYSVYNTILPQDVGFCIVDRSGKVVCHSDTARSLQENLLEETSNNELLKQALDYTQDTCIDNVHLYDKEVLMVVRPLKDLPYSLAVYVTKDGKRMHLYHVTTFTAICQSILILFVSLFSYIVFLSKKKMSKLFFTHGVTSWMKPSREKIIHYKRLTTYFSLVFLLLLLFHLVIYLIANAQSESFLLSAGLLLPLFITSGYYIVRELDTSPIDPAVVINTDKGKLKRVTYLLIPYFIIAGGFLIIIAWLQPANCHMASFGVAMLIALVIIAPALAIFISSKTVEAAWDPILAFLAGSKDKNVISGWQRRQYKHFFLLSFSVGVLLTSVFSCIVIFRYAAYQEEALQARAAQVRIAKSIENRCKEINERVDGMNIYLRQYFLNRENDFIDSLKYYKGIYTAPGFAVQVEVPKLQKKADTVITCTPLFYKTISSFLFLPPQHVEFFDNEPNYYYWTQSNTPKPAKYVMHYIPAPDDRQKQFSISMPVKTFRFASTVIQSFSGWFLLVLLLAAFYTFYRLIMAVARRIFLIDYFKAVPQNKGWLSKYTENISLDPIATAMSIDKPSLKTNFFGAINNWEIHWLGNKKMDGTEKILLSNSLLNNVYESIWQDCSDMEKLTLCDIAIDEFTNYKNIDVLFELYRKGLVGYPEQGNDGQLALMTKSFRNFLILKESSQEMQALVKINVKGTWANMRMVLYFLLLGVVVFIFISQEEASRRLLAIVTSLAALIPAMLKLFDKSGGSEKPAAK